MKNRHTKHRAARAVRERKSRVTFSLSGGSVQFLKAFQDERRHPSLSASVENMIEEIKRTRERAELNRSLTDYYNSFSDVEIEQDAAWGQAGIKGLAALEAENEQTKKVVKAAR